MPTLSRIGGLENSDTCRRQYLTGITRVNQKAGKAFDKTQFWPYVSDLKWRVDGWCGTSIGCGTWTTGELVDGSGSLRSSGCSALRLASEVLKLASESSIAMRRITLEVFMY